MDGTRVLRIDIDNDEDGKLDRWEYYDADQRLEKIGTSRANDGKEDAWLHAADGRRPSSASTCRRDATARSIAPSFTRTTRWSAPKKTVTPTASRTSGRRTTPAGWQSVAFDTLHRGTPDRRFVYGVDGSARFEVDPDGTGQFVAAETRQRPSGSRR